MKKFVNFASEHFIALYGTFVCFVLLWKLENHLNGR